MANSKATPTPVKPVARARLYLNVSCATFDTTAGPGAQGSTNWFFVPDEPYTKGSMTGLQKAWEVFKAMRDGEEDEIFAPTIEAAVKIIDSSRGGDEYTVDKKGAAVEFLAVMCEVLTIASKQLDIHKIMADRVAEYERLAVAELAHLRKKNAAFAASMTTPSEVAHG